jgi:hypothetical protein
MKLPYTSSNVTAVTYVDNAIRLYVDEISLRVIDMILFTILDRCLLYMIKIRRQQIFNSWISGSQSCDYQEHLFVGCNAL